MTTHQASNSQINVGPVPDGKSKASTPRFLSEIADEDIGGVPVTIKIYAEVRGRFPCQVFECTDPELASEIASDRRRDGDMGSIQIETLFFSGIRTFEVVP